ncbi:MAG: hypothetical protein QOH81_3356 [Sphingomonadales bacterium]|jgi:hypothetical protein|nr:hypothetical protein [Sphingomonadales bacterium]
MPEALSPSAKVMGVVSAATIMLVGVLYAIVLGFGFATLSSPAEPIGNPYFTVLEVLILVLAPAMVALMATVHAWSPQESKALSLAALSFTAMLATITCSVHFSILTLSGQPGLGGHALAGAMLAFKWPSVVYALDILAWDVFFALSMLFAALVFEGGGINRAIRISMAVSGVLALAGLSGVALGDMTIRNIGIAGYLGAFLVVDALLLTLFLRCDPTRPRDL